jgi:hypothetical protein
VITQHAAPHPDLAAKPLLAWLVGANKLIRAALVISQLCKAGNTHEVVRRSHSSWWQPLVPANFAVQWGLSASAAALLAEPTGA